ncbi:UNVERIFIED_CONTAM: hypothetical protein NCL1_38693 [Trichonephila clavipes]
MLILVLAAYSQTGQAYLGIRLRSGPASKHGVVGMMEALSEELRLKGSSNQLTTICPLTVNTGLNQNTITRTFIS